MKTTSHLTGCGRLVGIFVASEASQLPQKVNVVKAISGKGLDGDRYAEGRGTFSNMPKVRDVTLIEKEALQAFENDTGRKVSPAEARRNLLTEGVRLNELVDREFRVGPVRMRGLRLSEPCTHLAKLTHAEVLPGLVHRGGLVAAILEDGVLQVGDRIVVGQEDESTESRRAARTAC